MIGFYHQHPQKVFVFLYTFNIQMDTKDFQVLKIRVEKQIITVLDYLIIDKQIEEDKIVEISNFVLDHVEPTTNPKDLYYSFFDLLSNFDILSIHMQNTFKNLSQYSHA